MDSADNVDVSATHERWMRRRHRKQEDASYKDAWYSEQCGGCAFFIPLSGPLADDYGGCANPESPFDKRVMFEHDGCEQHREGRW